MQGFLSVETGGIGLKAWNYYSRGYLLIRIKSRETERFLNMCAHHGIPVWNLQNKEGHYEMCVTVPGFYRLKPICRKTGSRIIIIKKYGLPFFFYRNKKRKAFFIGILLGFCLLLLLSRHIWNIHVDGNRHNSTQTILNYLDELDIRHGILKKEVDCSYIAEQMRREFPDITWVSAKISGTRLILEVKENATADKELTVQESAPCNITAAKNGRIVSMITRKGIPCKKVGDTCTKGEVLVSGRIEILNDSKEVVKYEYTESDADIYLESEMQYYQEFPLQFQKNVPTGASQKGYTLQLGDYYMNLKGKPRWEQYETITNLHQMRLTENFRLPVFYGTTVDYASETRTFKYTKEGAEKKAREKLSLLLQTLSEKGVQISANHVKIEVNHSTCVAKGSLTVIEKAVKETPVEILEQPTERNSNLDE